MLFGTYIQYETNILLDHVNKNSVHGLAVLTGFSIVPEKGRPLKEETQIVEEVVLFGVYRHCLCYCMPITPTS